MAYHNPYYGGWGRGGYFESRPAQYRGTTIPVTTAPRTDMPPPRLSLAPAPANVMVVLFGEQAVDAMSNLPLPLIVLSAKDDGGDNVDNVSVETSCSAESVPMHPWGGQC